VSKKLFTGLFGLSIAFTLAGCQGVGSNATSTSTTPTIALNQSSVNLAAGASTQFTATVQNISSTAVAWSVDGVAGGNATVGTITSSGMYTAPAAAGSHTVTAAIVADSSISAKATVTVGTTAVTPSSVLMAPSTTQQFTASIQGFSNTAVTWSVDSVSGGNATVGTITSAGVYTAPTAIGSHTVTATSTADTSATASASVVVSTIAVTPATATMIASTTQQFTANVPGASNASLTWSVDGTAGGNSTVGQISASGLYTAPAQSGSHTITVASASNPSFNATATVSVFVFTISPTSAIVAPSASQTFTASIQGISNTGVTWSVDGVSGGNATTGTITSSGVYTAPSAVGPHSVEAISEADPAASVSSPVTVVNAKLTSVLTYHNDDTRDGAYLEEVSLTPSNVNATQFGKLLAYPVDGQVYAQPLYLPQITINGATHDVVFVETQNNSVYAFDADAATAPGTTFWHVGPSVLGPSVHKGDTGGVNPNVGILSTPVIDASTNTMYLVVETSNTGPQATPFFLHALDVTSGLDRAGSPVPINATYNGDVLATSSYQRMGLALNPVTNWIYIAFGDSPHGWVLAYDKTTLAQKAVFDDTNLAAGGGLWDGGGAPAIDDITGSVFVMTGTDYDDQWVSAPPAYTQTGYNDSFLNLNPNTLAVQSYFSPDNSYTLAGNDADLGSGASILVPGSTTYPLVTIGGGKDGNVFVLDPNNMGGFTDSNAVIQTFQMCTNGYDNIYGTPAYWNGTIYIHCMNNVITAYQWDASTAQISTTPQSKGSLVYQMHGASPSLSANGAMNGIIWDIDNSNYIDATGVPDGPSVLHAYDATNLATELYNSSQAGSRDTAGVALKFTVPTIANGRVFVPTSTELDIYGLLLP
jgi:hypothetical protein